MQKLAQAASNSKTDETPVSSSASPRSKNSSKSESASHLAEEETLQSLMKWPALPQPKQR